MLSIITRPQTFGEVIGQEVAARALVSIAKASVVPVRSIVLQGAFGCGKSSLARIFAKAVNCEQFKSTGDVCNTCNHCVEVNTQRSPLFFEYDSARVGNVDSVKTLIDTLSFSTPLGRTRVVVLDETHACSTAALTALLKVIEEGIPRTVFLFSTTADLMKTIMSRSCVIPVCTVPASTLITHVRKVAEAHRIDISDEHVQAVVLKSDGHVRNAMQILDFYRLVGEKAVETPYSLVSEIFLTLLRKQSVYSLIDQLSLHPVHMVSRSVTQFLLNCFSGNGAFETKVRDSGNARLFFNHFYSPAVRTALNDEYGLLLAFQTLAHKLVQ